MRLPFKVLPALLGLLLTAPALAAPPNVAAPPAPLSPELMALSLPKDGRFIATVTTSSTFSGYVLIPQTPRAQPARDWLVAVYRTPVSIPAGLASYVASFYELDCGRKLATAQMMVFYDAAGRELTRQPAQPPQRARKGSPLGIAYYLMCQGGEPKGRILQGIEAVLADAAPAK